MPPGSRKQAARRDRAERLCQWAASKRERRCGRGSFSTRWIYSKGKIVSGKSKCLASKNHEIALFTSKTHKKSHFDSWLKLLQRLLRRWTRLNSAPKKGGALKHSVPKYRCSSPSTIFVDHHCAMCRAFLAGGFSTPTQPFHDPGTAWSRSQ